LKKFEDIPEDGIPSSYKKRMDKLVEEGRAKRVSLADFLDRMLQKEPSEDSDVPHEKEDPSNPTDGNMDSN
jgi:hypothetical protein